MATDFTQDTLLHFLQSHGGQVKNSDLLLHFKNFIRDHADRNRNRELFKKFVNSVATVKQIDGVSYVVVRKKFRGHVPGGGEGGSTESPRLPAGKNTAPSTENAKLSPALSSEKPRQKPQQREVTVPAPAGVTAGKTILPAAGIVLLNNNNNVETNLNLKRKPVISTPELPGRPAAAQVVSQTPSLSQPPASDQSTKVGQHRGGSGLPPGTTPAVRPHGEPNQQHVLVPEPLRGREAHLQPEGSLHQDPPLHHASLQGQSAPRHQEPPLHHANLQGQSAAPRQQDPPLHHASQIAPRRIRHRKSYKSAVSYDKDEEEEEEEEEVQMRRGSAGGVWPLSTPLKDTGRAISASSPCIIEQPVVSSPSSSSSSERKLPQIYVQDVEGKTLPPGGPSWSFASGVGHRGQWEPGTVPGEPSSTRRSLPLEAERYTPSTDRATVVASHRDVHADRRYSQPAGVQLDQRQELSLNQGAWSSSHSSSFSPSSDAGFSSSDWPPSGSPKGSGWNSRSADLQPRAGQPQRAQGTKLESVMHHANNKTTAPWHHSTGNLHDDQEPVARLSPLHRSSDHLHVAQSSTARVMPWHLSTGDLYDREEAESSDGSTSSPSPRLRPPVARRVSSHLRSRMCRSLGADLDQLIQEEEKVGGGSEAARLNRLHMISSSLSLRYNLSSSSLSSCSTPPRCHSFTDLNEGVEGRGGRRSSPAAATSSPAHHEGSSRQSLIPLEPREHAWLVKGAAGAWPDIYTLFREDSSLLNRQDFISGFTVLHWIAKHGDHRVLNTLWYGVQKAGLTFDINAKSTCGHTPLHIAAMHGNKNMMRLLVNKFHADVKLRDTAGKKPWQYLSRAAGPDVFQLLGAPPRFTGKGEGGVSREETSLDHGQQKRRRRRHHLSFASSGDRPLTMTGTMRVKRSSSIAAFLKHKSMLRFHGHQSDSSL